MELVVGSLSTWSMRSWLCLKLADVDFIETVIRLGGKDYRSNLQTYSETTLVPVLIDGNLKIHDSLAISEYINEVGKVRILPDSASERAYARSLCAELHSGFSLIRTHLPFILEDSNTPKTTEGIKAELARLDSIWSNSNGTSYFDSVSAVDAYYCVMAYRLKSYNIEFDGKSGKYQNNLIEWELFQEVLQKSETWNKQHAISE